MAYSTLQIIIQMVKKGGADKETVSALNDVKRALTAGTAAVGAMVGAYYTLDKIVDATVGKFAEYANGVRLNSAALSLNAEETSRLTQVLDDFGLNIDSLKKALFMARKNGIDITVEGLAALADQYNALADPQEKAIFLQENFGKGGADLAVVLDAGRGTIMEYNDAIADGLVLTEKAVAMSEEYRLALDEMDDTWQGLTISMGQDGAPILTSVLGYFSRLQESINEQLPMWLRLIPVIGQVAGAFVAIRNAKEETDENEQLPRWLRGIQVIGQVTDSVDSATQSYIAWAQAIEYTTTAIADSTTSMEEVFGLTQQLSAENMKYSESMAELNDDLVYMSGRIEYLNGLDTLTPEQAEELETMKTKLGEARTAVEKLAKEHEQASLRIVYALLQQRLAVDGISDDEYEMLIKTGEAFGILDSQSAGTALTIGDLTTQFEKGQLTVDQYYETVRGILELPADKDFHYTITYDYISSGGLPTPDMTVSTGPGGQQAYAAGGQLGDLSVVGEQGWETIVRTRDGRYIVIPHEASVWMQAAGMLSGAPGYALGNLPMMDQALGGGSTGNQATGKILKSNQASGMIKPNRSPAQQIFGGTASAAEVMAMETAGTTAAASAVESMAPVVTGAVQMFQAASAQNSAEVARQTRIAEEASRAQTTLLRSIQSALEGQAEVLAAEIQKRGG